MAGPFYNNIKGTTSGTPGTGAFTPSAPVSGARAWSAVPAGWIGLVRFEDGSTDEESYCYWNGTTLSRGTNQLVASSTGSVLALTSAATAEMVADANDVQPHFDVPFFGAMPRADTAAFSAFGPSAVAATLTGTAATTSLATTNYLTEQARVQITSATTANAQAGASLPSTNNVIVDSTAGRGGFEFASRFGASQIPTGNRAFIGMTGTTMIGVTTEPSALTANYAVIGKDSTDTNLQLLVNSNVSGGTKIDTGIALVANGWYRTRIWCEPGSTTIKCLLVRMDTGAIFYTSTSSDTPVSGSILFAQAVMGLSSTTGTAVVLQQGGILVRQGAI